MSVVMRIETSYFQQILNQERVRDSIYATTLEMSSRMNRQIASIQAWIGQKVGIILYAVCMSLSGLFIKGPYPLPRHVSYLPVSVHR